MGGAAPRGGRGHQPAAVTPGRHSSRSTRPVMWGEAWQAVGEGAAALAAVERVERSHGPTPESAYRRGLALRSLGRRSEARAAFAEVPRAAAQVARYQRGDARRWQARATLARLLR
jgi:hypothetical protein